MIYKTVLGSTRRGISTLSAKNVVICTSNLFCQLVFEMEGFDVKMEGMFGGQVIPLLSVDGSVQGEMRNWSSAVSLTHIVNTTAQFFCMVLLDCNPFCLVNTRSN